MSTSCKQVNAFPIKVSELGYYSDLKKNDIFLVVESGSAGPAGSLYSRHTKLMDILSSSRDYNLIYSGSFSGNFYGKHFGDFKGTHTGSFTGSFRGDIETTYPVANVKTFGAKGDGITDDRQAIQKAIDYIISKRKGIVYFPSGNYKLNTKTDITIYLCSCLNVINNIESDPVQIIFKGDGAGQSRLFTNVKPTSTTGPQTDSSTTPNYNPYVYSTILYFNGFFVNSSVENLKFEYTNYSQESDPNLVTHAVRAISLPDQTISSTGDYDNSIKNFTIKECHFRNLSEGTSTCVDGLTILNNIFSNPSGSAGYYNYNIPDNDYVSKINLKYYGIRCVSNNSCVSKNTIVVNNLWYGFDDFHKYPKDLRTLGLTQSPIKYPYSNPEGSSLCSGLVIGSSRGWVINGNIINNAGRAGIYIWRHLGYNLPSSIKDLANIYYPNETAYGSAAGCSIDHTKLDININPTPSVISNNIIDCDDFYLPLPTTSGLNSIKTTGRCGIVCYESNVSITDNSIVNVCEAGISIRNNTICLNTEKTFISSSLKNVSIQNNVIQMPNVLPISRPNGCNGNIFSGINLQGCFNPIVTNNIVLCPSRKTPVPNPSYNPTGIGGDVGKDPFPALNVANTISINFNDRPLWWKSDTANYWIVRQYQYYPLHCISLLHTYGGLISNNVLKCLERPKFNLTTPTTNNDFVLVQGIYSYQCGGITFSKNILSNLNIGISYFLDPTFGYYLILNTFEDQQIFDSTISTDGCILPITSYDYRFIGKSINAQGYYPAEVSVETLAQRFNNDIYIKNSEGYLYPKQTGWHTIAFSKRDFSGKLDICTLNKFIDVNTYEGIISGSQKASYQIDYTPSTVEDYANNINLGNITQISGLYNNSILPAAQNSPIFTKIRARTTDNSYNQVNNGTYIDLYINRVPGRPEQMPIYCKLYDVKTYNSHVISNSTSSFTFSSSVVRNAIDNSYITSNYKYRIANPKDVVECKFINQGFVQAKGKMVGTGSFKGIPFTTFEGFDVSFDGRATYAVSASYASNVSPVTSNAVYTSGSRNPNDSVSKTGTTVDIKNGTTRPVTGDPNFGTINAIAVSGLPFGTDVSNNTINTSYGNVLVRYGILKIPAGKKLDWFKIQGAIKQNEYARIVPIGVFLNATPITKNVYCDWGFGTDMGYYQGTDAGNNTKSSFIVEGKAPGTFTGDVYVYMKFQIDGGASNTATRWYGYITGYYVDV